MRALIQRVSSSAVEVDGRCVGSIGAGLLILLGVENGDTEEESTFLSRKCVELRIFSDAEGKMNRSLLDIGGEALVVSQFTLLAEWRKGRRPGFSKAAHPDIGRSLYEHFAARIEDMGIKVARGIFAADMKVSLVNDGPVTMMLDTRNPE